MIAAIEKIAAFLLEHADLVDDLIDVLAAGTPKDAIKAAIRAAKVKISDEAMTEELGLD